MPKRAATHARILAIMAANSTCQKHQRKVSGNSTWHKVFWHVSEQVRKGAWSWIWAASTQEFNGQEKKAMAPSASAAGGIASI